jgi:crotonobetainyl-CoA:carnitine CoA-transferase CaiB-like acyl-CoA transferase
VPVNGQRAAQMQPGQAVLAVDVHTPDGQIVLELRAPFDVFLQNFRPGVVERLGIGTTTCAASTSASCTHPSGFGLPMRSGSVRR